VSVGVVNMGLELFSGGDAFELTDMIETTPEDSSQAEDDDSLLKALNETG